MVLGRQEMSLPVFVYQGQPSLSENVFLFQWELLQRISVDYLVFHLLGHLWGMSC